jgi:hypothetical protein
LQTGPPFLTFPRSEWPLTTEVCDKIPTKEVRDQHKADATNVAGEVRTSPLEKTTALGREAIKSSNNWVRTQAILMRALRAKVENNGQSILDSISPTSLKTDRAIQFAVSAESALQALRRGELQSLGAQERRGEVWISTRIRKKDLARLLGTLELRIIMPTERLARLIVTDAHQEDH